MYSLSLSVRCWPSYAKTTSVRLSVQIVTRVMLHLGLLIWRKRSQYLLQIYQLGMGTSNLRFEGIDQARATRGLGESIKKWGEVHHHQCLAWCHLLLLYSIPIPTEHVLYFHCVSFSLQRAWKMEPVLFSRWKMERALVAGLSLYFFGRKIVQALVSTPFLFVSRR